MFVFGLRVLRVDLRGPPLLSPCAIIVFEVLRLFTLGDAMLSGMIRGIPSTFESNTRRWQR